MFPETDSSQTIIDCFLGELEKNSVEVKYRCALESIENKEDNWVLHTSQGALSCEKLVMTTGSNPKIWKLLENLGHQIIPPVPSLFTFDIKDERIKDIPGVVVKDVEVSDHPIIYFKKGITWN